MKIRECSRAIIVNELNQILLQKFEFKNVKGNKVLWVTPGGGLNSGETPIQALVRELYEELGINVPIDSEPIFEKDVLIEGKDGDFISREFYYKIEINLDTILTFNNMTEGEKDTFHGLKWWSKEELQMVDDFAPVEILRYF